jgi:hypothetical protein
MDTFEEVAYGLPEETLSKMVKDQEKLINQIERTPNQIDQEINNILSPSSTNRDNLTSSNLNSRPFIEQRADTETCLDNKQLSTC